MEEQGGLFKDCTQSQSPSHSNFYKEYPRSVQDCEHLQRNIHQDLQQNKVHWKSFEQEQLNWNKCLNIVFFFRFPCVPLYGGFPVKLQTFIGKPIEHDPSDTPFTLREKCQKSLEELVSTHQRVPGSIFMALLERFRYFREKGRRKK